MRLAIFADNGEIYPVVDGIENAKSYKWDDSSLIYISGLMLGTIYRIENGEPPLHDITSIKAKPRLTE